nr:flocculation protein FLO11-like [Procambarus clarkii]
MTEPADSFGTTVLVPDPSNPLSDDAPAPGPASDIAVNDTEPTVAATSAPGMVATQKPTTSHPPSPVTSPPTVHTSTEPSTSATSPTAATKPSGTLLPRPTSPGMYSSDSSDEDVSVGTTSPPSQKDNYSSADFLYDSIDPTAMSTRSRTAKKDKPKTKTKDQSLLPPSRKKFAHRPTLKVAAETCPMLTLVNQEKAEPRLAETVTFSGPLADLVSYLAKALNFSYIYLRPSDGAWGIKREDGTWSGMLGMAISQAAGCTADPVAPVNLIREEDFPPLPLEEVSGDEEVSVQLADAAPPTSPDVPPVVTDSPPGLAVPSDGLRAPVTVSAAPEGLPSDHCDAPPPSPSSLAAVPGPVFSPRVPDVLAKMPRSYPWHRFEGLHEEHLTLHSVGCLVIRAVQFAPSVDKTCYKPHPNHLSSSEV